MKNMRSRTVFTLKHKYSAEDLEDGPESPSPVVKKKSVGAASGAEAASPQAAGAQQDSSLQTEAVGAASFGRSLVLSALGDCVDEADSADGDTADWHSRTLRPETLPADVAVVPEPIGAQPLESPPSRLAGTIHLAGTLTRSGFRKDLMRTTPIDVGAPGGPMAVEADDSFEAAAADEAAASNEGELCYCSSFVPVSGPQAHAAAAGAALLLVALSPQPALES
mmetsp:Transcript_100853/g.291652  ORF Transcript_100853/g.291652 Transcript_100853/m.291652 type:complete len:223 (-) Transcript_100853:143-811(-)